MDEENYTYFIGIASMPIFLGKCTAERYTYIMLFIKVFFSLQNRCLATVAKKNILEFPPYLFFKGTLEKYEQFFLATVVQQYLFKCLLRCIRNT